ncbi:hypothetical protein BDY21DRAFT_285524 [Lineolata rhizophorae]|uniref:Phosphoglucomutase-2 n=1 Tax=Lineolata rhizophorae TaxID=578093 RepID=A0A6A6P0L2_9PEZI|nr:hypothetical protein BDY21DRAFT_285524 [Lineolata rhizophorae]
MTNARELAEEWLRLDQDPTTREDVKQLLVEGKEDELKERMNPRIAFGTAGLRGPMQAGFARLNSLTVIQASQGLAEYLLEQESDVRHRGVVIGRDARHNSLKFAKLAAAAFVAKNIRVWLYSDPVHTPLVPFGVGELGAAAGVMVTASHNPAKDNGYKVYWSNGCQIIPPHDKGIADAILRNLEPVTWDTSVVDEDHLLIESAIGLVEEAYFRAVRRGTVPEDATAFPPAPEGLRFVYTPMHGVGLPFMERAAKDLGFSVSDIVIVKEQAQPDPNFPTVVFPNPEEKGALDLAMKTADGERISLILASDPDADRLAVAEKVDGKWIQFSGNQLGILLASYILSSWRDSTINCSSRDQELAMLASTVSSTMLATFAEREGFYYAETLTGFKWLGNVSKHLDSKGYKTVFAFEEALGYMIPSVVSDKDSIAAAAVFLTAAGEWQRQGLTPYRKLQELFKTYGYFEDVNTYLISPSPGATNAVFQSIRSSAGDKPYPAQLGSRKVLRWRDLTEGYDSATDDHEPVLPVSKESQMITCEVEGGVRFTIRGSGTEPKVKLYVEGKGASEDEARAAAKDVLDLLLREWIKPEFGLKLP